VTACHYQCVRPPSFSLLITFGFFAAAFGVVVTLLGRRKGDRLAGRVALLGVPGVYIAGLASWGEPRWLYVPGLGLIAGAILLQVVGWRRGSFRNDGDRRGER
jgi:hypothetical protein